MFKRIADFILDSLLKVGGKVSASKLVAMNLMLLNTITTLLYDYWAFTHSDWSYLTSVLTTQILGTLVAIGVVAASHLTDKTPINNDPKSAE
jgi:hypothetical protein